MQMLVLAEAPQLLIDIERSAFAAGIRQSVWIYPAANVGHILSLTLFAGAVAIMDLRLLGAFSATPAAAIVRPARAMAVLGLVLMALTGAMLFAAEASHVATNRVFQVKAGLIALGVLNALVVAGPAVAAMRQRRTRRSSAGARAIGGLALARNLAVGGRVRPADRVLLTWPGAGARPTGLPKPESGSIAPLRRARDASNTKSGHRRPIGGASPVP